MVNAQLNTTFLQCSKRQLMPLYQNPISQKHKFFNAYRPSTLQNTTLNYYLVTLGQLLNMTERSVNIANAPSH